MIKFPIKTVFNYKPYSPSATINGNGQINQGDHVAQLQINDHIFMDPNNKNPFEEQKSWGILDRLFTPPHALKVISRSKDHKNLNFLTSENKMIEAHFKNIVNQSNKAKLALILKKAQDALKSLANNGDELQFLEAWTSCAKALQDLNPYSKIKD